ncbi:MAG: hypothetical protein H6Q65_2308 [Firmicutes bacterium]|nr:hypothetical protein [Bacillota bacterium]
MYIANCMPIFLQGKNGGFSVFFLLRENEAVPHAEFIFHLWNGLVVY